MKAYCSSYYGCELWDLSCKAVDDFYIMWRKGHKRVWGLPRDTLSCLLATLCATILTMDELCRRSCNFINACLSSDCFLISFVARQSIFKVLTVQPLQSNCFSVVSLWNFLTKNIIQPPSMKSFEEQRTNFGKKEIRFKYLSELDIQKFLIQQKRINWHRGYAGILKIIEVMPEWILSLF